MRKNCSSGCSINFIHITVSINGVNLSEFVVEIDNWLGFLVVSGDSVLDSFFSVIVTIRFFEKTTLESNLIVNLEVEYTLAFATHGLEVECLV